MQPHEVGYLTELDTIYANELKSIVNAEEFEQFVQKWNYWLDDDCKELSAKDWNELSQRIKESRKKSFKWTKKHAIAVKILLPEKLITISAISDHFHVPWGCAYIRAKEEKYIDY